MNNGVNETTNQTTVTNTNTGITTQAQQTAAIASTHPQVLAASSGEAKSLAQAAIDAAGVQIGSTSETEGNVKKKEKKPKKKNRLARFYFFIIILLGGACVYLWNYHQQQMIIMNEKCTPVSTKGEEKELDLNSNIVKDLYSRVKTSMREDLGQSELNDELKLYLAYRQIGNSEFYESHCKSFVTAGMEPFTCVDSATFTPKAFKTDTIEVEFRKLFGYDAVVPHGNVQLGNSCIGGYQYIASRGEYVQGRCTSTGATLFRVDKELTSAYSKESTIVLREHVKYYGSEGLNVPERLMSGTYEYTFKLDMNYNYVYVDKKLVSE